MSTSFFARCIATGVLVIACSNTSAPPSQGTETTPTSEPAPEPGANDVILLQDDFNRATVALQLGPWANAGAFSRVTDGHGGEGLRVSYQSSSWNTNTIARDLASVSTDAYYRYWYRLSPGADASCGGKNSSGFKWFMTHRPGDSAPRYTHGVTRLPGGPRGFQNVGMEFSTHDNSSTGQPNPFQSNIDKSKRFNTTNDGQWHKYTLHVVTGNSGYEQIWIDGVKVLDSKGFGYDHSPIGIESISFPGTMVQWYSGCEFTLDVDDLVVWHK